jgi:hypothetical protein
MQQLGFTSQSRCPQALRRALLDSPRGGALEDADAAEISGAHAAYKCWFLAQVAYLAGNKPLCRREIKHIGNDPTYGPRAEELRRELGREPE